MTAIQHTSIQQPPVRQRLDDLAQRYARRGEVWAAVLTTWAVEIHGLEEVLWDQGLQVASDPHAELAAVGAAVARSMEAAADRVSGDVTAREIVQIARDALLGTVDAAVRELVVEGFQRLDHLIDLPASQARRNGHAVERLEERTAEQLVVELLGAAGDCMAVARELLVEHEYEAAARMARQADVATFEAYLVAAASLAGEDDLGSVQLRWDLARDLVPRSSETITGAEMLAQAVREQREQLVALLGSAEQGVLLQTFESAPSP
ncbi:hypothetical protein [Nocardioides ochotonae]|uniref:hypothetical protein n=1 Tax=Nocardioides ochotonae TaxID=2685869 RepID=UPI00140C649A|nr:hypothetical protein [Nocardioides ochotonae]